MKNKYTTVAQLAISLQKIHGSKKTPPDLYPEWDANPWVWVYDCEQIENPQNWPL